MKKIQNLVSITFFLALFSCANAQKENCVFDSKSITDDFLKNNNEILSYKWFDDIKTASVLMKTGEYVYVKKWACMSYGTEAKKIIVLSSDIDESISFWSDKLLDFGRQLLNSGDFEFYKEVIGKKDWTKGNGKLLVNSKYEIDIPHETYPEFYAVLERNRNMIIMTFSYYMN
ncbi:hypothetical protein JYT34_00575 [Olleya sp. AH-315-K02]|nr:hypothetical protein [bacterium AH-315-P13]MBN4057918.1 hypothetical protein [Olleya sp. AH-315-K02]